MKKTDLEFKNKDSEILSKPLGLLKGATFTLNNLTNCCVYLPGWFTNIYIDNCSNCEIHIGPVKLSVLIRNCKDCQLSLAAQDIRAVSSVNITIFIFSSNDLTIEKCSNIILAPYNFIYAGLNEHFKKSKLDLSINQGFMIMDFNDSIEGKNYKLLNYERFTGYNMYIPKSIQKDEQ